MILRYKIVLQSRVEVLQSREAPVILAQILKASDLHVRLSIEREQVLCH